MRRRTAAVGSAVFFLVAPGVVVGLIPWCLFPPGQGAGILYFTLIVDFAYAAEVRAML